MASRTVVVTGGSNGIGLAVAQAFVASDDHVVITGRRRDRLDAALLELGGGATALAFDASDPVAVASVRPELPAVVDVLVNSAGGNTDLHGPAPADDDLEALALAWRANLDANLLSAVLVTATLESRITDGGRVVTIGSIAAHQGAGSYGAAKAAVEAWNLSLAAQVGQREITANVVAPGLTVGTDFFRDRLTDERKARLIAATATRRAGEPTDVAAVVHFLASPAARHVTGQVIHVNGGAFAGR